MPARPPRKCSIVGDGIVTFGVRRVWLLQELEVGALDVLHVPDTVDHAHHGRRELLRAVGAADRHHFARLDAAQLLQEIDMEVGPAELAVGDGRKADPLLHPHDFADRAVLDLAQRCRR